MAIDKQTYRHDDHTVNSVQYHFVWCPKRRKKVLKGAIAKRLRQLVREVAEENNWHIIALAVRPDHVHLFVQTDTRSAPYQVVRAFKGRSSRVLRKEYPRLLKLPSLWTRSYFCATTGKVSQDVVKRYIEEQS